MYVPVSIQKKQVFLQWVMDNLNVAAHDMNWFLQDLLDNEHALQHVHFVDDITDCPKGIIITSHLNEQICFRFFKGKVQSEDVYTAYHEMNLYRDESIYIQINFPFSNQNKLYLDVIEDDELTESQIKVETDEVLNYTLKQGRKAFLMEEVHKALDNRNHEQFMYYSAQLKKL